MKINPIISPAVSKKFAFKGYTLDARTPWGTLSQEHLSAGINTGRPYEKTVDSFHSTTTGLIYYADPMEQVSDGIRESVDYVFYDVEPQLPDIETEVSKDYFEEPRSGYTNEKGYYGKLDDCKQYFYRLEMADRKTLAGLEEGEVADYYKDRISKSQYNQETAANCQKIYTDALELIYAKDSANYQMSNLRHAISERRILDIKSKEELEQRKQLQQILEDKIAALKMKQGAYQKINESFEASEEKDNAAFEFTKEAFKHNKDTHYYNVSSSSPTIFVEKPISTRSYQNVNLQLSKENESKQEEMAMVSSVLKRVEASLDMYSKELETNNSFLKMIETYINETPATIKKLEKELISQKTFFEKTKADLIPHFDKLKNYFNSRGLKVIK